MLRLDIVLPMAVALAATFVAGYWIGRERGGLRKERNRWAPFKSESDYLEYRERGGKKA